MARQNVSGPDGLAGWFDPATATMYAEGRRFDGENMVSLATGAWSEHEALYHTSGGRWVLNHWSAWQGRPESWAFVTDEQARDWLLRCEYTATEVEQATGAAVPAEEDRRGGRPEVGPAFSVKFPPGLRDRMDAAAAEAGLSRAEWLRRAAEAALR